MSWPTRSYPKPIPVDQPIELPSDLPVPSTSRVLQPRSRAASLARSAGSQPGSRASSRSGDSRTRGFNEVAGPPTQETLDWFDNSQNMQSFFDPPDFFPPFSDFDMSQPGPSQQMDYQSYNGGFDTNPMYWNEFGHDLSTNGFSLNNDSIRDPSPNQRKRKRKDSEDSNPITPHAPEGSNQGVMEGSSTLPSQRSVQQAETSTSGSSGKTIQRKKYEFKFSTHETDRPSQYINPSMLIKVPGSQNMSMNSPPVSQQFPTEDRKGKGKAKAQTPDPSSIIEISDSPPAKPKETAPKKPPNEPLSAYTCPICFSAPTNATLTPCGHICCGACLFAALKSTMQRSMMGPHGGVAEARCPVCRAIIPGWDGKGGGVIGLKPRAIFRL